MSSNGNGEKEEVPPILLTLYCIDPISFLRKGEVYIGTPDTPDYSNYLSIGHHDCVVVNSCYFNSSRFHIIPSDTWLSSYLLDSKGVRG